MKTQPGLPPTSILIRPALPTILAPWWVYSHFLPPILPIAHPRPLGQGFTYTKFSSSFQHCPVSTAWGHDAAEEAIASAKKNLPAGHRRYLLNYHDRHSSTSPPGAAGPRAAVAVGPISGKPGFGPALRRWGRLEGGRSLAGETPRWVQFAPSLSTVPAVSRARS